MNWSEFLNWSLGFTVIYLILCPPKWDPAIRWKEWRERRKRDKLPECFGSIILLRPSDRAENSCHDCPHRVDCVQAGIAQYPERGNDFHGN